ncbi:MAG: deoxycytidylate deaminase [Alphaproteobacteria bacterium]|nr:deoxycytidylate deaminase [Alphaproteobacteria bacterium]MCD8525760.1 deoxycytidylate deaminase [Alphaproteobacteria bacterium]MCD8571139.1 deoxycytidylate deaminase [Alphaproteobacteria bacterium]
MNAYVFNIMQATVDVVGSSLHPTNKIAAGLWGNDRNGQSFSIYSTNIWPSAISQKIGHDHKIGNASGTIHAEIACILKAPLTNKAQIFITDPPCPNCVKALAEAGIHKVFIDHKGFDKDFAQRRGHEFEALSLPLCREAGIGVYEVRRKEERLTCLQKAGRGPAGLHAEGCHIIAEGEELPESLKDKPYAQILARGENGINLIAANALTFFSFEGDTEQGKYTPVLEPLTRILMIARREGLDIMPGTLHSSRIPTSRELVNMVGAGISSLSVGDMNSARDIFGPIALKQLTESEIITVIVGK